MNVSVDVQFSGDESRRLFTSSAKVPENTMENRNLTYGSVVFQLKDANLEANNICDFVFRGLKVVCRTRVVTVCLMCLSPVPVLMFIYGKWRELNGRFYRIRNRTSTSYVCILQVKTTGENMIKFLLIFWLICRTVVKLEYFNVKWLKKQLTREIRKFSPFKNR